MKRIKVDPKLFKEATFNVTVSVSGIPKVQECDCWLCEEITETLPTQDKLN